MNLLLTSFRLSKNSVPCDHRTEIWISLLVVGRKPLWTQGLLPFPSHCSLHHKPGTAHIESFSCFESLWFPTFAFSQEKTLILRAFVTTLELSSWLSGKVRKIPLRRKWQPTPVFLPRKFHGQRKLAVYSPRGWQRVGHDWAHRYSGKESACHVGDVSSIPRSVSSPGEGNGNLVQYSCYWIIHG